MASLRTCLLAAAAALAGASPVALRQASLRVGQVPNAEHNASTPSLVGASKQANSTAPAEPSNLFVDDPPIELPKDVVACTACHEPPTNVTRKGQPQGGTSCSCACGDRVVWRRMIFQGDVVDQKEFECEYDICPHVNIPGLKVHSQCEYVEDITDLSAGSLCRCQCGDMAVWRNAAFRGDVADKMQKRCLEEICPRVQPIPGYRFEGECHYDKYLFVNRDVGSMYGQHPRAKQHEQKSGATRRAILPAMSVLAALAMAA